MRCRIHRCAEDKKVLGAFAILPVLILLLAAPGTARADLGVLPRTTTVRVGGFPIGAAFDPTGAMLYVTNSADDTVSLINIRRRAVVATISVGKKPRGIAANPTRSRVYVANKDSGTLSVIDTSRNAIVKSIKLGKHRLWSSPQRVAVSPDGTRIYVTGRYCGDASIWVIDANTERLVHVITYRKHLRPKSLTGSLRPEGIAVSPDGRYLYVAHYFHGGVSVVDARTYKPLKLIETAENLTGVAVSPDGSKIYATGDYLGAGALLTFDASTYAYTRWKKGEHPEGIAVDPGGVALYLSDYMSSTVSVINAEGNARLASFQAGHMPRVVVTSHDGRKVCAVNYGSGSVTIVEYTM